MRACPIVGANAESRVAGAAQVTLEAWRKRGVEGTVEFAGREAPAQLPVDILLVELLVHAWDFAQASGQSGAGRTTPSAATSSTGPARSSPRGCVTASSSPPNVEAGPDADNLARLAAFTGREG